MNIFQLSVKNWTQFAKEHILTIILAAASIALITVSLHMNHQIQEKFEKNLAGVDMIIAAKGSPLQIMLSSLYHIDAPTGNITLSEVSAFFREKHPYIRSAVPLGLGDSYRTYRIVGTTEEFSQIYPMQIIRGRNWEHIGEVVIGAEVAVKLQLSVGDEFQSAHGYNPDDMTHNHTLKVVGVYAMSGCIIDQLIVTSIQTIWEAHEKDRHEASHHTDVVRSNIDMMKHKEKDITSILIRFMGNNMQTLQWPQQINRNTNFQAVTPAIEASRMYHILGQAGSIGVWIGRGLLFLSLLSIILNIYLHIRRRKTQLSIMRMIGIGQWQRIAVSILELLWTLLIGVFIGLVIAHISIAVLSSLFYNEYKVYLNPLEFLYSEFLICLIFVVVGIITVFIPALQASKAEVGELLRSK